MSFTVQPDRLGVEAALTARDAGGVDEALHLVAAAGRQAEGGVSPGDLGLLAAVSGYVHVETTAAAVLAEATRLLATGFAEAGSRYASAESAVLSGFVGGRF